MPRTRGPYRNRSQGWYSYTANNHLLAACLLTVICPGLMKDVFVSSITWGFLLQVNLAGLCDLVNMAERYQVGSLVYVPWWNKLGLAWPNCPVHQVSSFAACNHWLPHQNLVLWPDLSTICQLFLPKDWGSWLCSSKNLSNSEGVLWTLLDTIQSPNRTTIWSSNMQNWKNTHHVRKVTLVFQDLCLFCFSRWV